jgi:hypothetical protein
VVAQMDENMDYNRCRHKCVYSGQSLHESLEESISPTLASPFSPLCCPFSSASGSSSGPYKGGVWKDLPVLPQLSMIKACWAYSRSVASQMVDNIGMQFRITETFARCPIYTSAVHIGTSFFINCSKNSIYKHDNLARS